MKLTLIAILALALSGCTTETRAGKCVGLLNRDEKKPALEYSYSYWNLALAFVFSETVIVPVVVVAVDMECPR